MFGHCDQNTRDVAKVAGILTTKLSVYLSCVITHILASKRLIFVVCFALQSMTRQLAKFAGSVVLGTS